MELCGLMLLEISIFPAAFRFQFFAKKIQHSDFRFPFGKLNAENREIAKQFFLRIIE